MKKYHILGLIPARVGSVRLKEKNIRLVNGKPMIAYAINVCKKSKFIDDFIVSTDSDKIKRIVEEYGGRAEIRPKNLSGDNVPTQDVLKYIANHYNFDVLVLVQANSPQVNVKNVDKAIKLLIDNNLWEVRSVNSKGLENGAFWVVTRETIFWDRLSCYFGVVVDDAIDIHTKEDLETVNRMLKENES